VISGENDERRMTKVVEHIMSQKREKIKKQKSCMFSSEPQK
jgi:hypothetical protein